MKEEGRANPSQCISQRESIKNLCILSEDAKQSRDESRGIVIFEKGMVQEMRG